MKLIVSTSKIFIVVMAFVMTGLSSCSKFADSKIPPLIILLIRGEKDTTKWIICHSVVSFSILVVILSCPTA